MERKGQERDTRLPNSNNYNPPQIAQESPVKLPLAPLISTPPDRRGNAAVSTRRGGSIFCPTHVPDHHRHQQILQIDPLPDPDPARTTAGTSNTKAPAAPPQPQAPLPQVAAAEPEANSSTNNSTSSIRYKECLKNHAASIGAHIVDGCGEFMSSGEEGTPEALKCAACDCHRNFHRKEEFRTQTQNPLPRHHHKPQKNLHSYPPGFGTGPTPPIMVNFGDNGGGAPAESSGEDLNMVNSGGGGHESISGSKKRFRTKFSQEQKDRMHEFATKLEWRMQKQDDQEVQRFCSEVGVKRQVFKVWMHNKQALKKRQIE